jgi:hypothetical protein
MLYVRIRYENETQAALCSDNASGFVRRQVMLLPPTAVVKMHEKRRAKARAERSVICEASSVDHYRDARPKRWQSRLPPCGAKSRKGGVDDAGSLSLAREGAPIPRHVHSAVAHHAVVTPPLSFRSIIVAPVSPLPCRLMSPPRVDAAVYVHAYRMFVTASY